MDSIRPDNVSLWIVSYKRKDALLKTVASWVESYPFKDINIVSNYPQDFSFLNRYNVTVWPNVFRPHWLTGSLAWCWNQAMLNTFAEKDWCIMSQDDVTVLPGWDQRIESFPDYLTYIAPHGDVIQIQSIEGFNKIGWFDERFRAIGGAEADYLLRIMRSYPDLASIHDEHVWRLFHNDIGLAEFFINSEKIEEVLETRVEHNLKFADKECFIRWRQKWGEEVDKIFLDKNYNLERVWYEIDWYPAFTENLLATGRKQNLGYEETI